MKFEVLSALSYNVQGTSTFILKINVLRSKANSILKESLTISPFILAEEINTPNVERYIRFQAEPVEPLDIEYKATVDVRSTLITRSNLIEVPIVSLPADVVPFLFPSRYCQSDRLGKFAQDMFGHIDHPYDKVVAIVNWINGNVEYVSGSTNGETSAVDTITQRVGVCRDFAHLAIALTRALSIPARYFSGYAYNLQPPDFHACMEVFLGGKWIVLDPTKLAPLNGLVRIAGGRDAADTAVASVFGYTSFKTMQVNCWVQEDNFQPLYLQDLQDKGLCLE